MQILDGCKVGSGDSLGYEAEDHLLASVTEKSVIKASFDAEESEKSLHSLGALQTTKTDMFMGEAAEEPIFYDKLTWGEISAERSDTSMDSTGVIASKNESRFEDFRKRDYS